MASSSRNSFNPQRLNVRIRQVLPGAAIALVIGALAHRLISEWLPVSSLLIAIVLGMAMRSFGWVPGWAENGLKWCAKTPLRIGIVLLGLQLAIGDIIGLGWETLVIIVSTVVLTFFGIRRLGPLFRSDTSTTALLATGTSICGASAVAAAASAIDRGDGKDQQGRDIGPAAATALAVVTLWGTVAMVALPVLVSFLGFDARPAGVWIGASVHEVAQVVAAGGMVGAAALAVATVVKLARVLLLAPAVVAVRLMDARPGVDQSQARTPILPWFVVGFLGAVVLNSVVAIDANALDFVSQVTTMLLTIAMAAVGSAVDLRTLWTTGLPAILLGGAGTLVAVGTALVGVALLL